MNSNTIKNKVLQIIVRSLALEKVSNQRFQSQWGIVKTSYKDNLIWIELLDRKVSIVLEDREDLTEYIQDSVRNLIPYDIIKESVQYKIF